MSASCKASILPAVLSTLLPQLFLATLGTIPMYTYKREKGKKLEDSGTVLRAYRTCWELSLLTSLSFLALPCTTCASAAWNSFALSCDLLTLQSGFSTIVQCPLCISLLSFTADPSALFVAKLICMSLNQIQFPHSSFQDTCFNFLLWSQRNTHALELKSQKEEGLNEGNPAQTFFRGQPGARSQLSLGIGTEVPVLNLEFLHWIPALLASKGFASNISAVSSDSCCDNLVFGARRGQTVIQRHLVWVRS